MTAKVSGALVRITLSLLVLVAVAGCEVNLNTEGLTAREKRTFTVTGQPDVTLETFEGAVEIHSWDRNEVEIEVEKRGMDQSLLDDMTIEAEQEGDRIVFRVKGPRRAETRGINIGVHYSPQARLLVAMPRKSALAVRTGDGSIRVEDVEGRIALRTGDGSVGVDRVSGEIEIRTGDGSIRAERVEGRLDVETSDGTITLDVKPSVLRAHTGDGSIRAQIDRDSRMADDWDVQTNDGNITIALPTGFDAEIDAESSDGSVQSSHPDIVLERDDERRSRERELKTRMGGGGHVFRIRTGDGTIRIEG